MAGPKKPKSVELREAIARRLRAARIAYEPNAAEVARRLEIDPRVLSKYEKGGLFPDELFVVRFCELTGCPADFLYLGRITQEMDSRLAARIGVIDPELVPPPSASARQAAAPEKVG